MICHKEVTACRQCDQMLELLLFELSVETGINTCSKAWFTLDVSRVASLHESPGAVQTKGARDHWLVHNAFGVKWAQAGVLLSAERLTLSCFGLFR